MFFTLFLACSGNADNPAHSKESSGDQKYEITFVELGSVECIPCRMIQPVMERVERNFAGKVTVLFYLKLAIAPITN